MTNLAPNTFRQRLLMVGFYTIDYCLVRLCPSLLCGISSVSQSFILTVAADDL
jgi:hypothetical protein